MEEAGSLLLCIATGVEVAVFMSVEPGVNKDEISGKEEHAEHDAECYAMEVVRRFSVWRIEHGEAEA